MLNVSMKPSSVFLNLGGFTFSGSHKKFQIPNLSNLWFLFSFRQMFFFQFPILRRSHSGFHGVGTHCLETVAAYIYIIFYVKYTEI